MKFLTPIIMFTVLFAANPVAADEGVTTCQVQVSRLNVRSMPSMRGKVLWDIRGGAYITTTGGCGMTGWTALLSNGGKRLGYVAARALREIEDEEDISTSLSPEELSYHLSVLRLRIADLERRVDEAEMRLDRAQRRSKGY